MLASPKMRLAVCVCGLAFVWLVVLPAIGRLPAVRETNQWLDAQGIDPSAMYYTELEVMPKILQDLE